MSPVRRALTHDATPSEILCEPASVGLPVPSVRSGSVEIHYEVQGAAEAPALLLLHSLGVDLGMWDPQMPDFCGTIESFATMCAVTGVPASAPRSAPSRFWRKMQWRFSMPRRS